MVIFKSGQLKIHSKDKKRTGVLLYIFLVCFFVISITSFSLNAFAETEAELKAELNNQIDILSQEVEVYRGEINEAKKKKNTLENELWILGREIKKINTEIKETDLMVTGIESEMSSLETKISVIDKRINEQKILLANAMRMFYEKSNQSFLEIVLSQTRFSDFFDEMKALEDLDVSLKNHLDEVKLLKVDLEAEHESLDDKKGELGQAKRLQEVQRNAAAFKEDRNETLLKETKGKESLFQGLVKEKQKDIQAIRERLYQLEGGGVSMSLGEALGHAEVAASLTGIRPAFLLALLKQESQWNKNVGQCYLSDPDTGDGIGMNTGNTYKRTMKPSRDVGPFMQITKELGLDPYGTLVSCPHANYGYGGAMGPAQFIPSTWIAYKDRLTSLLGHTPNPWSIRDAFVASAVKLTDAGAKTHTYTAEHKAAMKYYAGGNWWKSAYQFYGNSVMELAASIQEEVDILNGN